MSFAGQIIQQAVGDNLNALARGAVGYQEGMTGQKSNVQTPVQGANGIKNVMGMFGGEDQTTGGSTIGSPALGGAKGQSGGLGSLGSLGGGGGSGAMGMKVDTKGADASKIKDIGGKVMPMIQKVAGMIKSDEDCKENITRSSYDDMKSLVAQMRGRK